MNIFVLDEDPRQCAIYHNDRHVSRMILDCAQLLSTAHVMLDGRPLALGRVPVIERPGFATHPCARWVRECRDNYTWTVDLMQHHCNQFALRHGKGNELARFPAEYAAKAPFNIDLKLRTRFACAVPVQYERSSVVDSYRAFYFGDRQDQASWTVVGVPYWWSKMRVERAKELKKELASG